MRQSTTIRFQVLAAAALAVIILAFTGGALLMKGGYYGADSAKRADVEKGTAQLRKDFQQSAYLLQSLFVPSNGRENPSDFLGPLAESVNSLRLEFASLSLAGLTPSERRSLNGLETSLTGWNRLVEELVLEARRIWNNPERMDAMARIDMPLAEHHRAGVLASLDELALSATANAAAQAGGTASWMRMAGASVLAGLAMVLAWAAVLMARAGKERSTASTAPLSAGTIPDHADVPLKDVALEETGDMLSSAMLRLRQSVHDVGRILRTRNDASDLAPEHAEDAAKELAEASFMLMDVVEEMATCAAETARPLLGTAKTTRIQ